jgi:hypothetical protein
VPLPTNIHSREPHPGQEANEFFTAELAGCSACSWSLEVLRLEGTRSNAATNESAFDKLMQDERGEHLN